MTATATRDTTVITCNAGDCTATFSRPCGAGGTWPVPDFRLLARLVHGWDTAAGPDLHQAGTDDFCPRHERPLTVLLSTVAGARW